MDELDKAQAVKDALLKVAADKMEAGDFIDAIHFMNLGNFGEVKGLAALFDAIRAA